MTRATGTVAVLLLMLAPLVLVEAQEAPDPSLGAALAISSLTHNANGVYTIIYRIILVNAGSDPLRKAHIEMPLADVFSESASVRVLSAGSHQLDMNPAYDGIEDQGLLLDTSRLAAGEQASVELSVEVTSPAAPGPYPVSFTVRAESANGETVEDRSHVGADPDPDGNGDPTDNNDPTPTLFTEAPRLGSALRLRTQSENADGSYNVAYDITVANYGDVVLRDLQIAPGIASVLAGRADFDIVSITSETLSPRLDFDGEEVLDLLDGSDVLGLGQEATLSLVVRLRPLASLPRLEDRVLASAVSPLGTRVADLSQRGSDPDPDGDGNPGNDNQISRAILALLSIGGQAEFTVSASETEDLSIDGLVLNVFASLQEYAVQLTADLPDTGLSSLKLGASGPLGPFELSSALAFDAATVSFDSWQAGAAVDFFGIDIVDLLTLSVPQTTSTNQLTLSAGSEGISFQGSIRHTVCPVALEAVNLCGSWDWVACDVALSGCLLFSDTGFESFTVSMSDYTLFEDVLGASGTLDATLIYTTDEKTLAPTLRVEPDWIVCPEISLLGEVLITSSPLGIEGASIYGIAVEAPVGPVVFEIKDSFTDAKNSSVTGKAEYFEMIGVSGSLVSCCGTPGSFSVQTFFERGPNPPSGGLFGIGLIAAAVDVQLFQGFGFTLTAEYRPVSPTWSVVFESAVVW